MFNDRDLEHPDITQALRTGYPHREEDDHYCEECGKYLPEDEIYEDENHKYLCSDCLLSIHKRWW